MKKQCLLSLCIPTNGISEWVLPVLNSIYSQNVNEILYEIIITDNGSNEEFYSDLQDYLSKHNNIVYKKTNSVGFLNQIESFKLANGLLIKFINHRMLLKEGTINYFISIINEYSEQAPVIYFSNGNLNLAKSRCHYTSFDEFVRHLSYYSSWSAGLAFWKKDLVGMLALKEYNNLFPHIDLLFYDKMNLNYFIDNTKLLIELPADDEKKGKYNIFYAFAVEYPAILLDLFRKKEISYLVFSTIKNMNKIFVARLYSDYILHRKASSYIVDNATEYINVFYNIKEIEYIAIKIQIKMKLLAIKNKLLRK